MPDHNRRQVQRAGRSALLIDCGGIDDVLALHTALTENPLPDQLELVPAATTLLARFRSPLRPATARELAIELSTMIGRHGSSSQAREVEIPVRYDGEDLEDVAAHLGTSTDEVVARHTATTWTAAFSGFSPGFAYLVGVGRQPTTDLTVPRRDNPRTKVPAGSVALAGEFSAVYPSASPGGWQLIGTTNAPVWDLDQEVPALITPGTVVRFLPARDSVELQEKKSAPGRTGQQAKEASAERTDPVQDTVEALRIDAPGLATMVQDRGREGHTDWGVSPSGWADAVAAQSANRLVGNEPEASVLENTAGGLAATALMDTVLAVTGAEAELTVQTDGTSFRVPRNRPFALLSGQRLAIGPAVRGLRIYLAVRGGIRVDSVLGSTATDTLAKLGPTQMVKNAVVRIGPEPRRAVELTGGGAELPPPHEVTDIRVSPGPRIDWFTSESVRETSRTVWSVTEESNRVGVRLARPAEEPDEDPLPSPLTRTTKAQGRELPSEGIVAGAIQVPPSGNPVVFMADHPVTGGYPVIGVVEPKYLRLLAQSPPGTLIRLVFDAAEEPIANTTHPGETTCAKS
ncbi:carboxyltransferase domain-containing protein [Kocuria sp. TGY1127_2]|uniref:5-oxoprolinase subunit B/C family protein n=1 Tax=Kocuria sp. TGY1127_2 TaxID=2711328 RepID=UPI0015C0908A|nr:carboxyltransferase domain-containing protein [Kocuria sp. TGY1127_2]